MKREKNDKFPLWQKTSPGTLVLRKPSTERIKPKQQIRCEVGVLGRFALTDVKLIHPGKGDYKVNEEIIEKSVAVAEESLIRKGKDIKSTRKFTKLKDIVNSDPVVGTNVEIPKVVGDDKYDVVHKGGGKWIVTSATGKKMHDGYMDKDTAKALKKQLKG